MGDRGGDIVREKERHRKKHVDHMGGHMGT